MKYQVEIIETLARTVEVEAESRREARDKVWELYGQEKVVLGADNHVGTELEVV